MKRQLCSQVLWNLAGMNTYSTVGLYSLHHCLLLAQYRLRVIVYGRINRRSNNKIKLKQGGSIFCCGPQCAVSPPSGCAWARLGAGPRPWWICLRWAHPAPLWPQPCTPLLWKSNSSRSFLRSPPDLKRIPFMARRCVQVYPTTTSSWNAAITSSDVPFQARKGQCKAETRRFKEKEEGVE